MPGEQLPLSFEGADGSKEEEIEQPLLFEFRPDVDVHLADARFAHVTVRGSEVERTVWWLGKILSSVASVGSRRFAFPAGELDRLLCVMPPAKVTLDAACLAVARALWAHHLGFKPLRVARDGQRLLGYSPRWPTGWKVVDAPWNAIAALEVAGVPLDVEPRAKALLLRRMADAGRPVATCGLAGSSVSISTNRPDLLEALELPALAYAGERGTGRYRLPILSSDVLLREPLVEVPEDVARTIKKATSRTRAVTAPAGFPWELYAFQARDLGRGLRILEHTGGVLFAGDMGSGKSLASDTIVLQTTGSTKIGDLRVGDEVLGADGKPHRVTGVYPQGVRPMFRITFTDHTSIRCDAEHLWSVHSELQKKRGRPGRVLSTAEIVTDGLRDGAGNLRHYIPTITSPLEMDHLGPRPVPGYTLGALLGAGGITQSSVTDDEGEVAAVVAADLGDGGLGRLEVRQVSSDNKSYIISDRAGSRNLLKEGLVELGMWGLYAWEKHIPSSYLYGPAKVRAAVLQGLLDTGGGVTDKRSPGSIEFCSTSEQLVDDVAWLVQSLGGTARKSGPRRTTYTHSGERRVGRPSWWLSLALPEWVAPFRSARKAGEYRRRIKYGPTRGIVSIEADGEEEAVCISVDAPDQLYVTEHAIVTHNTTVSLAAVETLDCWPVLVVAPLAAFSTWERQLGEMGRENFLAVGNPDAVRERIVRGDWDVVVVSYDRLHLFQPELEAAGLGMIIADEIQRIRTPTSRRSRALRALAGAVPRRIGLSGTPVTNRPEDVLPLGAFLVPGEWPPRLKASDIAELYPGDDPVESLAEHLGTLMVRRRIDQVGVKLPGRSVSRVQVPLSADQRRALHEMEEEARSAKEAGELGGHLHVFARLQKMRQIVNVPHVAGVAGPNPKVAAAVDLAEQYAELGRKSVIFVADRPAWTQVGDALSAAGIGWTGIWGSTPIEARIANEKAFHVDDSIKVFVGTLAACAESLTLSPTATVTIFAALSYSPSAIAQAAARTYRMNQVHDVDEIYLHASAPGGTLDDRMHEILEVKRRLIAQVVDRTEHVDGAAKISYGDLVFMITGERDLVADQLELDARRDEDERQRRKAHARATLYQHKTGEVLETGEGTMTREQWEQAEAERLQADVDDEDAWEELL
jgi:hypothetical protein